MPRGSSHVMLETARTQLLTEAATRAQRRSEAAARAARTRAAAKGDSPSAGWQRWRVLPQAWQTYGGEEAFLLHGKVWVNRLGPQERLPDGRSRWPVVTVCLGAMAEVFAQGSSPQKNSYAKNPQIVSESTSPRVKTPPRREDDFLHRRGRTSKALPLEAMRSMRERGDSMARITARLRAEGHQVSQRTVAQRLALLEARG
jgi:hypothetical protein